MNCSCGFTFSGPGEFRNSEAFITMDGKGGYVCPKCGSCYVETCKAAQQQISELRAEIEFRGKRIDELIKSNACNFDKAIKSIEELHKKKYEIETHRKLDLERISQIAQLQSTVRRYDEALNKVESDAQAEVNRAQQSNPKQSCATAKGILVAISRIKAEALTESTNPPQQVESSDTTGEKG